MPSVLTRAYPTDNRNTLESTNSLYSKVTEQEIELFPEIKYKLNCRWRAFKSWKLCKHFFSELLIEILGISQELWVSLNDVTSQYIYVIYNSADEETSLNKKTAAAKIRSPWTLFKPQYIYSGVQYLEPTMRLMKSRSSPLQSRPTWPKGTTKIFRVWCII